MDFGWNSEQNALRQEVRDFIATNVTEEVVSEMEEGYEPPPGVETRAGRRGPLADDLWQKIKAQGWLGVAWPQEYGGLNASIMTQVVFNEVKNWYQNVWL